MLPLAVLLFASSVARAQDNTPANAASPAPAPESAATIEHTQGPSPVARDIALFMRVEALRTELRQLKREGRPRHYHLIRGLGGGLVVAAVALVALSPFTIVKDDAEIAAAMVIASVPVGVAGIAMIVVPKLPVLNSNRRQINELEEELKTLEREQARARTGATLGLSLRVAF